MKISIALPTYNGGRYLKAQLESIRSQTVLPDELVITDDASTDGTLDIAEDFRNRAEFRVNIFRNQVRLGCNQNFGKAISNCGGDLIALSDQDDVWLPRHLASLSDPFDRDEDVSLVVSDSEFTDEALRSKGTSLWKAFRFSSADARRLNGGPALRQWLKHHATSGHASAFRADLVPVVLPFPEIITYDQWLGLVCSACGKVRVVDEILTMHRQHGNQAIGFRDVPLTQRVSSEKTVALSHFDDQIDQLRLLEERLDSHPEFVREHGYREVLKDRISLFEHRRQLRQGGAARRLMMATVLLLSGQYHRVGRGLLTYARDIRG